METVMADAQQATPPKRRRRWLRRTLWLFGLLLALLFLSPLALAVGPVRNFVAGKVGDQLGRKVEIDSAFAFWGRGVDLEGITIHGPEGSNEPLATIGKIHAEIDVVSAVRGKGIKATVRVVDPHIKLQRTPSGEWNYESIAEQFASKEPKPPEPEESKPFEGHIQFALLGGRIETPADGDLPANVVDDIQLTAELATGDKINVSFKASLVEASQGGGNAVLAAEAKLAANQGPVSFSLGPKLDLSRVRQLLESTSGVKDVAGVLEIDADATLGEGGSLVGGISLRCDGLRAVTPDAASVSIQSIHTAAKFDGDPEQQVAGTVRFTAKDITIEQSKDGQTNRFVEPSVVFNSELAYGDALNGLEVKTARLDAGQAVILRVQEAVRVQTDPQMQVTGIGRLDVDLARLAGLKALVPALEPLQGGRIAALMRAEKAEGLSFSAGVNVKGLTLGRTEWWPNGFREPSAGLTVRYKQAPEGNPRVLLYSAHCSAIRTGEANKRQPLEVELAPEGTRVGGPIDLTIDLGEACTAAGTHAPFEPGEKVTGIVRITGTAQRTADVTTARLETRSEAIRFPPSLGAGTKPAKLYAKLGVDMDDKALRFQLERFEGLGVYASAQGSVPSGEEGAMDVGADVTVGLRAARPWLGEVMALDRRTDLRGLIKTKLNVKTQGDSKHVTGTTTVTNVYWRAKPADVPIQERTLTIEHNVAMGGEGGRTRLERMRVSTQSGLVIDASGSSIVQEPETDMDVKVTLGGNAPRLASLLRGFLGKEYADLKATGRLDGKIDVRGSTANNNRNLIVDGNLGLGSWSQGGFKINQLRLVARRTAVNQPLAATLTSNVNGGTLRFETKATLGGKTTPWQASLDMKNVDTSKVVSSSGLGEYLTFAMPVIVPSDQKAPILSGRLNTDVTMRSTDTAEPAMLNGLNGRGVVTMKQGEVRNSTLFRTGGTQMDKLIGALRTAVPEAGGVLARTSRHLAFKSMISQFQVARRTVALKQVALKGENITIAMKGRVHFDERCNLNARVTLENEAGRAVARVIPDRTIPMRITGTLDKPNVVPNVRWQDLAGGAGKGLIDKVDPKKLKDRVKDLFK